MRCGVTRVTDEHVSSFTQSTDSSTQEDFEVIKTRSVFFTEGRLDFPRIWLVDRTKSLFYIRGLMQQCMVSTRVVFVIESSIFKKK